MAPKISVIVPCWGVEKYLDRCMNSIVNQTLKDIEIILVDDGSPDKVPQMCDEWAKKDSRIIVIHKENEGLGFARNTGLEIASGDYIAFVDSDDYIDKRMYEHLYQEARVSAADAIFCGVYNEQKDGTWKQKQDVKKTAVYKGEEQIKSLLLDVIAAKPKVPIERPYRVSVWHSIYKHSIIKEHRLRFYSERKVVSEDLPFQCSFLSRAKKVIYLPDCYYYYCLNGTSLTGTFRKEKFYGYLQLRQTILDMFKNDKAIELRINRHIIGLCRNYVRLMVLKQYPCKIKLLKEILNNPFWEDVKKNYHPSYLPPYQAITYWLQVNRQTRLLLLWTKISLIIKKDNK